MIFFKENSLVIRSMIETDIKHFVHAFSEQDWDKPLELFEDYFSHQSSNQLIVFVAEVNHEVAGYVTLFPRAEKGPFASKGIPEIVDLNVLIKFQEQGIGNQLMEVAERVAKEKGKLITLAVGMHKGYGAAQRMYVKRGYIPDGSGVWYKGHKLPAYEACRNDDDFVLYFSKEI
jgi:predicted N-acetyltransferase YhbS